MHLYAPVCLIKGACYFLPIKWPTVGNLFVLTRKGRRQQSEPKWSVVELLAADHLCGSQSFQVARSQTKGLPWCFFWQPGLSDHHIWSWKTKSRQFISHICPFILAITWSNPQGSVPKPSMESSVFFRKAKAHGRETSFAHHLHTPPHSQPHLSVFIYDYIDMASW